MLVINILLKKNLCFKNYLNFLKNSINLKLYGIDFIVKFDRIIFNIK